MKCDCSRKGRKERIDKMKIRWGLSPKDSKNQWGWCGFVTQKLKPTRAMARLIAIVANWWNVFCRLAEGGRHMNA